MPARKSVIQYAMGEGAWVLYADIGYNTVDQGYVKAVNVGIAEMTMVGMAAGMASEGGMVWYGMVWYSVV